MTDKQKYTLGGLIFWAWVAAGVILIHFYGQIK